MDNLQNSFSPGAGTQPPTLAGRQDIIDEAVFALQRMQLGRPFRCLMLTGLRGVSKTVILNHIKKEAEQLGCKIILLKRIQIVVWNKLYYRKSVRFFWNLSKIPTLN